MGSEMCIRDSSRVIVFSGVGSRSRDIFGPRDCYMAVGCHGDRD